MDGDTREGSAGGTVVHLARRVVVRAPGWVRVTETVLVTTSCDVAAEVPASDDDDELQRGPRSLAAGDGTSEEARRAAIVAEARELARLRPVPFAPGVSDETKRRAAQVGKLAANARWKIENAGGDVSLETLEARLATMRERILERDRLRASAEAAA